MPPRWCWPWPHQDSFLEPDFVFADLAIHGLAWVGRHLHKWPGINQGAPPTVEPPCNHFRHIWAQKVRQRNVFAGAGDHLYLVRAQRVTRKSVFARARDHLQQVQVQKVTRKNVFVKAHDYTTIFYLSMWRGLEGLWVDLRSACQTITDRGIAMIPLRTLDWRGNRKKRICCYRFTLVCCALNCNAHFRACGDEDRRALKPKGSNLLAVHVQPEWDMEVEAPVFQTVHSTTTDAFGLWR